MPKNNKEEKNPNSKGGNGGSKSEFNYYCGGGGGNGYIGGEGGRYGKKADVRGGEGGLNYCKAKFCYNSNINQGQYSGYEISILKLSK